MQILAFDIGNMFMRLCLMIDTIIYKAVGWMYSIFYTIASSRIFSSEVVSQFLSRIYSIIGVVMLFIVAYSLLNVIINPDNLSKGKSTPTKVIFNIVLSLISIIFIPTIFNFGYSLQGAVMQENVLGKLILGTSSIDGMDDVAGGRLAVNIFQSSFYLTENADDETISLYNEYSELAASNNDVSYFDSFIDGEPNSVTDGYIHYNYILCGLIGCYVLYCLLLFCFDVGVRAVKLLFLEIIAPLPSLLLIVPGQDKVFKAWTKETISTFLSLFIRVLIIFFAIFLANAVDQSIEAGTFMNVTGQSFGVVKLAKLFIYLGIFTFARQFPKLMGDLFGIKLEGGTFNLKKRLDESGLSNIIGAAGGVGASIRSNRIGALESLEAQRKNGAFSYKDKQGKEHFNKAKYDAEKKKLTGLKASAGYGALGAYYGLRGGFKGIGTAWNAGFDTQLYKANGLKTGTVLANLLRDNLGIQSYYEEEIKKSKIRNDAISYRAQLENTAYEKALGEKQREIDNTYNPAISAQENRAKAEKAYYDHVEGKVSKPGSSYTEKVVTAEFMSASDEHSKLTTNIDGTQKNAFQIDGDIAKVKADAFQIDNDINSVKAKLNSSNLSPLDRVQLEGELNTLNSNRDGLKVKLASLTAARDSLLAQDGSISYKVVDANTYQIKDIQDNFVQRLIDAGASAVDAQSAFAKVMGIDKASGTIDADIRRDIGTAVSLVDNYGKQKDAIIDAYGNDFGASGIKAGQDSELTKLVSEYKRSFDNDAITYSVVVGTDPLTGKTTYNVVEDVNLVVNQNTDFVSGAGIRNIKKKYKDVLSGLVSAKNEEIASQDIENIPIYDSLGNVTGHKTMSMNQVLLEIEKNRKAMEEAQKAQKLFVESLQGLKVADDARKTHQAAVRRPGAKGK